MKLNKIKLFAIDSDGVILNDTYSPVIKIFVENMVLSILLRLNAVYGVHLKLQQGTILRSHVNYLIQVNE